MDFSNFLNKYTVDHHDDKNPNPEINFNRGLVHMSSDQFLMAISEFDKAISLKKDYWEAYFERAKCLERTKQYDKALADLETLENNGILSYDIVRGLGWYSFVLGRYEKCVSYCDKILASNTDDLEILEQKAKALFALNRFKEAIDILTSYINTAQGASSYNQYFLRGVCSTNLKEYENAIDDFIRCTMLEPEKKKPLSYLAYCYYSTGQTAGQKKFAQMAVESGDESVRQFL